MQTTPTPPPAAATVAAENRFWPRFAAEAVRLFHDYGNWLVSISWKRFLLLAVLLLILAGILSSLGSRSGGSEEVTISPAAPATPATPATGKRQPTVKIQKKSADDDEVTISINKDGVRISPRRAAAPAASAASAAASAPDAAASAASSAGITAIANGDGVQIRVPAGADSEAVRDAVEEARAAVVEAIRDSQRATEEAAAETEQSNRDTVRTIRRIKSADTTPPFMGLAWFWILASAILKITYKGRIQAEVKAAVATENAESEQLKRQVVEARMAAMQAQVEPHFLFNTLASIDHLIETDPPRASQMQKNLIALLRASMPSMRESNPLAHNLGREMAVIRPYLEILKVRMEDRLQADIRVPEGLLSADFPPMMIQSLVENAIKHGLEPKAEGGRLTVSAEIVHGKLAVTVADTGMGFGKAETAGTGIGLANIRERLQLLYGDRASVVVADNQPSGTTVTLTVPYLAQPMAAGREGGKA